MPLRLPHERSFGHGYPRRCADGVSVVVAAMTGE